MKTRIGIASLQRLCLKKSQSRLILRCWALSPGKKSPDLLWLVPLVALCEVLDFCLITLEYFQALYYATLYYTMQLLL